MRMRTDLLFSPQNKSEAIKIFNSKLSVRQCEVRLLLRKTEIFERFYLILFLLG